MHRVFKGRLTTTGMKKIVSRKKFFLKYNVSIAVLLLGIYSNIAAAEASQFSDSGRNSSISQQKVTNVAFVVTGQVFDNTKSPLPGVTVAVKGGYCYRYKWKLSYNCSWRPFFEVGIFFFGNGIERGYDR